MSILGRIRRILRANLHEVLERAEQPAMMVNYLVIEMRESLTQAREEVARAMAAQRRCLRQAEEGESAAAQWEARARHALAHGEEELAREALRRRMVADEIAGQYRREYAEQARAIDDLRAALGRLEARLHEAHAARTRLLARAETARAQRLVARSLGQTVGQDAFAAFDRFAAQLTEQHDHDAALAQLANDQVEAAFVVAEEGRMIEAELHRIQGELTYKPAQDEAASGTEAA